MTQAAFTLDTMHRAASYEQLHAGFHWDVPARFNLAWDCCGRHAVNRERFALYYEDESGATAAFSYWDLQVRANRLANALASLGVRAGERVAILLPQRPETADPTRKKAQSHIRAARRAEPQASVPETGPMAAMLRKLFGKDDT